MTYDTNSLMLNGTQYFTFVGEEPEAGVYFCIKQTQTHCLHNAFRRQCVRACVRVCVRVCFAKKIPLFRVVRPQSAVLTSSPVP